MILRAPRPESNWSQVRNEIINDPSLSFKATAVLIYILSKPDHWRTSTAHLATVKREGLDAVRTAMGELTRAGYVRTRRYQDALGRWQFETEVYDIPQPVGNAVHKLFIDGPPHREKPHGENGDVLVKTDKVKTKRGLASSRTAGPHICGNCNGHGRALDTNSNPVTCPTCNGQGFGN